MTVKSKKKYTIFFAVFLMAMVFFSIFGVEHAGAAASCTVLTVGISDDCNQKCKEAGGGGKYSGGDDKSLGPPTPGQTQKKCCCTKAAKESKSNAKADS